jgi:hypothetical protein
MGVFDRFEKGVERAVNIAFAKAFRSEVQPVEIASALRREVDDKAAVVDRDRTLVPNTFVVELGQGDHGRLGEWEDALAEELAQRVVEHAGQQRYMFVGPVTVTFREADDLDTGVFRVSSSSQRGQVAPPAAAPVQPLPSPPPPVVVPPPSPRPAVRQQPAPQPSPPPVAARPVASARQSDTPDRALIMLDVDGRRYRLTESVTIIGRGADAHVMLDDAGVSRRHAEIHLLDGMPRVIDLGSTNGTFLDGERVHAGALSDGSVITVGRTRIVVHLTASAAAGR